MHKRAVSPPGSPAVLPPPALRRNYTVCALLHDRASEERDATLSQLLGYKWAMLEASDGTVRECSDGLASALGVAQHRLCGQRLADCIVEADRTAEFAAAIATGEPLVCAVTLKRGGEPADGGGGDSGCAAASEPTVTAELHMAAGSMRLSDGQPCRLCLVLDSAPADEAGAAEPALARLAECLRLQSPFAPALRESLSGLARTFLVTDPTQEDNPIVFASDVRRRAVATRGLRGTRLGRPSLLRLTCSRPRPPVPCSPTLPPGPCAQAFCEMTGYSALELLGRNCRLLQGPATDLSVIRQVRAAVQAGKPCTAELDNYKRDGTAFVNLLHFAPIRDTTGAIAFFVGVQSELKPAVIEAPPAAEAAAAAGQQAVGLPLPTDMRETATSVESALSQHLRDILKSSILMQTFG
jgi:PAS domain S-box-containing protein